MDVYEEKQKTDETKKVDDSVWVTLKSMIPMFIGILVGTVAFGYLMRFLEFRMRMMF